MQSAGNISYSSHRGGNLFELFVHLMFQQKVALSAVPLKPADDEPNSSLFNSFTESSQCSTLILEPLAKMPKTIATEKSKTVSVTQNSNASSYILRLFLTYMLFTR